MSERGINYTNSAFDTIQSQRHVHPVPIEPRGTIHDYVPFYFNSLSPMLYSIKCGNIDGVNMQDLVFFKSTAQIVSASGSDFVFTDGHGIMALSEFYNDLAELDQVPWDVINSQYWNDFPDGKRLRQSEFLVYKEFNWNLVELIGVYNSNVCTSVTQLVDTLNHQPIIQIKRNWYF